MQYVIEHVDKRSSEALHYFVMILSTTRFYLSCSVVG